MGSIHSTIQQASEKPQPTCCVHSVQGTGLPLQSTCVHTCGCTGQPRIKAAWGRGNTFFSLRRVSHSHVVPCTCGPFKMTKFNIQPVAWRSPLQALSPVCQPGAMGLCPHSLSPGAAPSSPESAQATWHSTDPPNAQLPTQVHLPLCSTQLPLPLRGHLV